MVAPSPSKPEAPRVRFLESAVLARAGFGHGFTTRHGTLSDLGLEFSAVYTVSQVHGSDVLVPQGPPDSYRGERADALLLSGNQCGAIRVADCVPVLVGDTRSGRAAAIHAGWRGVASGVVPAALAAMRSRPRDFVAAIGPCIESCCFEVGEDVAEQLAFAVPCPGVVARTARGKAWVDLALAVRAQLEASGVDPSNIERVGACTKCDATLYHSYRRDGAESGRMMGVIRAKGS